MLPRKKPQSANTKDEIPQRRSFTKSSPASSSSDDESDGGRVGNGWESKGAAKPGVSQGPDNSEGEGEAFWKQYNKLAARYVKDETEAMNGSLDTTLIFAGLFSAVNSTLLSLSLPSLSADPNDRITSLLQQIATQNTTVLPSESFTPSGPALRNNILFSLSLLFSVFTAFGAVIGKQWLVSYGGITRDLDPASEARLRQKSIRGGNIWHLRLLLEMMLPHCLLVSLVFFVVGMVDFLWNVDSRLGICLCVLSVLAAVAVLITVNAGILTSSAPFQTPLSHLIRDVVSSLRGKAFNFVQPFERSSIPWIGSHPSNYTADISKKGNSNLVTDCVSFAFQNTNKIDILVPASKMILGLKNRKAVSSITGKPASLILWTSSDARTELVTKGSFSSEEAEPCTIYNKVIFHIYVAESLMTRIHYMSDDEEELASEIWWERMRRPLRSENGEGQPIGVGTELAYQTAVVTMAGTELREHCPPLPLYIAVMIKRHLNCVYYFKDRIGADASAKAFGEMAVAYSQAKSTSKACWSVICSGISIIAIAKPQRLRGLDSHPPTTVHPSPEGLSLEEDLWSSYVDRDPVLRYRNMTNALDSYDGANSDYPEASSSLWKSILMQAVAQGPEGLSQWNGPCFAQTAAHFARKISNLLEQSSNTLDSESIARWSEVRSLAFNVVRFGLATADPEGVGDLGAQLSKTDAMRREVGHPIYQSFLPSKSVIDPRVNPTFDALVSLLMDDMHPSQQQDILKRSKDLVHKFVSALQLSAIPLWVMSQRSEIWFDHNDEAIHALFQDKDTQKTEALNLAASIGCLIVQIRIHEGETTYSPWSEQVVPLVRTLLKRSSWIIPLARGFNGKAIAGLLARNGLQGAQGQGHSNVKGRGFMTTRRYSTKGDGERRIMDLSRTVSADGIGLMLTVWRESRRKTSDHSSAIQSDADQGWHSPDFVDAVIHYVESSSKSPQYAVHYETLQDYLEDLRRSGVSIPGSDELDKKEKLARALETRKESEQLALHSPALPSWPARLMSW